MPGMGNLYNLVNNLDGTKEYQESSVVNDVVLCTLRRDTLLFYCKSYTSTARLPQWEALQHQGGIHS